MTEQLLIAFLVFLTIMSIGGAVVVLSGNRRAGIVPRLRAASGTAPMPLDDAPQGAVRLVGELGSMVSGGRASPGLREQLARAGYFGQHAAAVFVGSKLILLMVALGIVAVVWLWTDWSMMVRIYIGLTACAAFFFAPNFVVRWRRLKRASEVRQHLPGVVDLVEICVSSGMGIDMAWNCVTDEIRSVSPVLADEMALTVLEMQLGAPRATAMRNMAERTGAQELTSLVALLVQSERFGTSVADALQTFAESMRDKRSHEAEERAEKLAVKLLFPLVLFIFPVMLIVMTGPAGITLYRVMGS